MDLQSYITSLVLVVNQFFIPFLIGIAFLLFIVNVIRYFVWGGSNPEAQDKAKALALYGILAFVLLIIFWGIVNMLTQSLGVNQLLTTDPVCSDFDPSCSSAPAANNSPGFAASPEGGLFGGGAGDLGGPPAAGGEDASPPALGDAADGPTPPSVSGPGDGAIIPPAASYTPAPLFSSGLPLGIVDAAAAAAAAETRVQNGAAALAATANANYNPSIATIVIAATDAVNDSSRPIDDRAIAAIRLHRVGALGTGAAGDQNLSAYISTLNVQATIAGQPPLDMTTLQAQASQQPATLQSQITFTQNNFQPLLADANRGLFDFGAPNASAVAAADNQIVTLYSQNLATPAQIAADPNANDLARIAFFDTLASNPSLPSDESVAGIRTRFIAELNAERFFRGLPPLVAPGGG